jgi:hypothetical protein
MNQLSGNVHVHSSFHSHTTTVLKYMKLTCRCLPQRHGNCFIDSLISILYLNVHTINWHLFCIHLQGNIQWRTRSLLSLQYQGIHQYKQYHAADENPMLHRLCGRANTKSSCVLDMYMYHEDEIPIYRWQDDGKQIKGGGAMLDSRFVPCNRI